MQRLTFVCTANVCRSPLMQFTLLEVIGDPAAASWAVTSRGTHAEAHTAMCDVSARMVAARLAGTGHASSVRSTRISKKHCSKQHLLIAATLIERSELASLHPPARAKTFTLREAIWLGEQEPSAREIAAAEQQVADGVDPLEAYANLLHWRRGTKTLPNSWDALHRIFGNPLDVPDAHAAGTRQHAATLRRTREYTERFANQMLGFLSALK